MNQNNNHPTPNVNPPDPKNERGSILKPVLLTVTVLAAAMSLTYAMVVTKTSPPTPGAPAAKSAKPNAGDDDSCPEITDNGAINANEFYLKKGNTPPMPHLSNNPQYTPGYDANKKANINLHFTGLKFRSWSPSKLDKNSPGGDYTAECYLTAIVKGADGDDRKDCSEFPKDISYGTVTWHVVQITNQCVATTPANQSRTTIGVGEDVNLWLVGSPSGTFTWSTSAGSVSPTSGTSTTLTAPGNAATATVTVSYTGGSCSQSFNVIEPANVYYLKQDLYHTYDKADIGFKALVYLQPDSVNFGAVLAQEEQAYCTATGVYSAYNGLGHQPYIPVVFGNTVVSGRGTGDAVGNGLPNDTCYSGITDITLLMPYTNGTEKIVIPWDFKVGNGSWKKFTSVTWNCSKSDGGDHGDGLLNASKSNASVQMNVDDQSIPGTPPAAP
jgi:hypothetical protein